MTTKLKSKKPEINSLLLSQLETIPSHYKSLTPANRSNFEYVPFERIKIEYEPKKTVSYINQLKTRTDYIAIENYKEYIPIKTFEKKREMVPTVRTELKPQNIVQMVPNIKTEMVICNRVQQVIDYQPIEKSIIHYPLIFEEKEQNIEKKKEEFEQKEKKIEENEKNDKQNFEEKEKNETKNDDELPFPVEKTDKKEKEIELIDNNGETKNKEQNIKNSQRVRSSTLEFDIPDNLSISKHKLTSQNSMNISSFPISLSHQNTFSQFGLSPFHSSEPPNRISFPVFSKDNQLSRLATVEEISNLNLRNSNIALRNSYGRPAIQTQLNSIPIQRLNTFENSPTKLNPVVINNSPFKNQSEIVQIVPAHSIYNLQKISDSPKLRNAMPNYVNPVKRNVALLHKDNVNFKPTQFSDFHKNEFELPNLKQTNNPYILEAIDYHRKSKVDVTNVNYRLSPFLNSYNADN